MPKHIIQKLKDTEANILAIGTANEACEGQLYFTTDTQKYYYGLTDGSLEEFGAGGGGGGANLAATLSATNIIITNDTGTDATIPLADGTNAGLISPTQKGAIDIIDSLDSAHLWIGNLSNVPTQRQPSGDVSMDYLGAFTVDKIKNRSILNTAPTDGQVYAWSTSNNRWEPVTPLALSNFSASSPLSYNSGTGAFSIQQANGSQAGYLSSTDWTTFNNKYAGLPTQTGNSGKFLTTNGTTESWATVTIPLAANPTASLGLAAVNGAAGTFMRSDAAPALDQSIAPTWSGQHIFSLAPRFSTMTTGSVLFAGASGVVSQDNTNLFWDATNFRLGIRTTPSYTLDMGSSTGAMRLPNGTTAQQPTGAAGLIRFNTSANRIERHNGTSWDYLLTGTFTSTRIAFGATSGGGLTESANLAYDAANLRMWVGGTTGTNTLNVVGTLGVSGAAAITGGLTTSNSINNLRTGDAEITTGSTSNADNRITLYVNPAPNSNYGVSSTHAVYVTKSNTSNLRLFFTRGLASGSSTSRNSLFTGWLAQRWNAGTSKVDADAFGFQTVRNSATAGDAYFALYYNNLTDGVPGTDVDIFRITSAGLIGVGAITASQALDINGNLRIRGTGGIYDYNNASGNTGEVLTRGTNGVVWSALHPEQKTGSYLSNTTDANGRMTVTHGLGSTPTIALIMLYGTTAYAYSIQAKTSTTFTVQFYDMAGTVLGSGVAIDFDWLASK